MSLTNMVIVLVIGGAIGAFIVYKLFIMKKETKEERVRKFLEHCFGEAAYAGSFSLSEARDWIKARKTLMEEGAKALVAKARNDTLKMLGRELNLALDAGNYLVIAIVSDAEKKIKDSVLIKYDRLEPQLEDLLAKGNGVLVVEK